MLYNDYTATREALSFFRKGVWQTTDKKGGCQMTDRESDSCVLPMRSGNAERGKASYMLPFSCKGHIYYTQG